MCFKNYAVANVIRDGQLGRSRWRRIAPRAHCTTFLAILRFMRLRALLYTVRRVCLMISVTESWTHKGTTLTPNHLLGLAMNWGFVVVWVYLVPEDRTYLVPASFFAGTIAWTIVYDTIYACQDRLDDIKAGNNSTAVLFGDNVRPILALFATAFVAAIAYAGVLNHQSPIYYLVTAGGAAVHLLWQLITLKPEVPADCWQKFKANGDLGWIVFLGIAADYFFKIRS
ncbi:hypothetical protein DXG01_002485 [Tephrocybe rancida]|nr:hypothetical protein DXG01_002485 [Tephrocybe rancida]